MVEQFYNPVATYFGCGALSKITELTRQQNIVLVTFPEARRLGLIDQIEALLGERLIHVIEDVQPNPDVAQLRPMYQSFWQNYAHCDCIVALGGGSSIDTAKALMVATASGQFDELVELLSSDRALQVSDHKPLIAIPTTAGTGSEVTPWATIWDSEQQRKYSLHLDCTWPTAAIIDPELMLSLPENITVSTGLDALSHALEAIWNVNANSISDTFAVAAIQEILQCLPALQHDLSNLQLRSRMAFAALQAGLAFSNTKTALAHSISYEMTLHYGLTHGIACSFTLAMVLEMAWGVNLDRDQVLQQIFSSDLEQAKQQLTTFLNSVNVKTNFSDYGVTDERAKQLMCSALQGARGQNFISVS